MVHRISFVFTCLVLLSGCSSMIVSSTPPPVYYQLDYQPVPINCGHSFKDSLRIWDFATSKPFDQPDMVVVKSSGQVLYSSSFQWAANPGTMIAQSLLRDLNRGSLFPQVVSGDSPTPTPLELTGHVFDCSWQRDGATSRAVLQVTVSLIHAQTPRKVLFRHTYNLHSSAFKQDDSAAFAKAMSQLVSDFSTQLRKDLCANLSKNAPSQ